MSLISIGSRYLARLRTVHSLVRGYPVCVARRVLDACLPVCYELSYRSLSPRRASDLSPRTPPWLCSPSLHTRSPVPARRSSNNLQSRFFALRLKPARHPVTPASHFIDRFTRSSSVSDTTGRFRGTIMTRHAGRRQRPYDYDEPYNPLPRPRGASALPTKQDAQGWWVGGEWVEAPPGRSSQYDRRSRLSPIVIDDDDDSDCCEVPPPASRTSHAGRSVEAFDFNDGGQNVPWATSAHHGRRYEVSESLEAVRSLSVTATSRARSRTPLMMSSSRT